MKSKDIEQNEIENSKLYRIRFEDGSTRIVSEHELILSNITLNSVKIMHPYLPQKPYGSAFYNIDDLLKKIDVSNEYFVEKKYNGFHVSVHKKGQDVKIFSEQKKDITKPFPTLVENIVKLSSKDFVADGELVPYSGNKALGRSSLMKFIGAVKSGKQLDDSNIKLHLWDITYYNGDITKRPLIDRKKTLSKLKFNNRITNVKYKIVSGEKNIIDAIEWAAELPGSEGAVIKDTMAEYNFGEDPSWRKYRHLIDIHVVVIKKIQKERGLWNYLVGIYVPESKIDKRFVIKVNNKNTMVLGKTFNTKEIVEPGSIVDIAVEEVWRHITKHGVHYSIHKPKLRHKRPDLKSTSTIKDLDEIVVAVGEEVKEYADINLISEGKEQHDIKNFPKRMQSNFRKVMEKKLWLPFVMQWHLRGERSLHTDHRFYVPSKVLEGFTYFSPPSLDKPDKITKNVSNVRGTIKLPEPKSWINVQGRFPSGAPGTTSEHDAFFVIVAKGKYTIHDVTDHKIVYELKCDKGKVMKFDEKKNPEWYVKALNRKTPDNLKNLDGVFSFHIAHIGDKHIILLDRVKYNA